MSTPKQDHGLQADAIGLLGATTLGVVFLSPAMTLYGLFGPIFLAIDRAAPLAFVFALLATLPTAYSYAVLARDHPTSGSAADWAALAAGRRAGTFAGWLVFLYYLTNFVIQPVALGMFVSKLLPWLGPTPGFLAGVALCGVSGAWIVYRGITISTRGALAFLLVEIGVVAALCVTVVLFAPGRGTPLTFEGFSVGSALAHPGLMSAMVFGMLAYCGFDVISTVAEEAKTPRTLIPQATVLALVVYAALIIAGMWALTMGGDPEALRAAAKADQMPINAVADSFWGSGAVLVTLTGISASLGLAIATAVGASRVLFSAARRGSAPAAFARLHPRFRVPWNALHVIFAGGAVGALVSYRVLGAYKAFEWWASASTFFAMLTYLFVNLAVPVLKRDRLFASAGGFVLFAVIPGLGVAADAYLLVRAYFAKFGAEDGAMETGVVVFAAACAALALGMAAAQREPTGGIRE
ncbi:MAG: APC family permease [Gemmataceae bacterium]